MKKIALYLTLVFLFAGFAQAQNSKTLTGVVVDEIFSNKWSAVVIKVGNKNTVFELSLWHLSETRKMEKNLGG